MLRERQVQATPGGSMFLALFASFLLLILLLIVFHKTPGIVVPVIILLIADGICFGGLFTVAPNEGKVLQLFGRYVGTVRDPGWKWANPFYTKRKISLRIR